MDRLTRSRVQGLIFRNVISYTENKLFECCIKGSSDSEYTVSISNILKCTCIDYRLRSRTNGPCKHIYFLLENALRMNVRGYNTVGISLFRESGLDNIIKSFLKNRNIQLENGNLVHKIKEYVYNPSDNCTICFEELGKEIIGSNNCTHVFHGNCMKMWLKAETKYTRQHKCPLCRSNWD